MQDPQSDPSSRTETIMRQNRAAMIVRPDLAESALLEWFDPSWWASRAKPVGQGGRGGAWFIDQDASQWVLREYRRGGLAAKLSRRTYLFSGEDKVRSFAEFRLLQHLATLGLPAPVPVAGLYRRIGPLGYQADILLERIEGALTFEEHPNVRSPALWSALGALVSGFHRAGVDHVDLNVNNVLVSGEQLYLIDFDRCCIRNFASNGWQAGNLERLHRSIEKNLKQLKTREREDLWTYFLTGYDTPLEGKTVREG